MVFSYAFAENPTRALARRLNRRGLKYFKAHEDDKALRMFQMAVKADPTYDSPHANLAEWYLRYSRLEDAASEYQKAITANGKVPRYYLRLGEIYHTLKKYDKAITQYRNARELASDEPKVYYGLGLAYKAKGDLDKALENFKALIDMLGRKGRWKENEEFTKMYWESQKYVGEIYYTKKKWNEAYAHFKKVYDEAPSVYKATVVEDLKAVERQKSQKIYATVALVVGVVVVLFFLIFYKKFIAPQKKKKGMPHLPSSPADAKDYRSLANFAIQHLKVATNLPKALVYFVEYEGEPLKLALADGLEPSKYSEIEVNYGDLPNWIKVNKGTPFVYEVEKKEIPFNKAFPRIKEKLDSAGPRVGVPFIHDGKLLGVAFMCYPQLPISDKKRLKRLFLKNTGLITDIAKEVAKSAFKIYQKNLSIRDNVTPAYNQIYFKERLSEEIGKCRQKRAPLCLFLFECDGIVKIQKRFGEERKNHVLKTVVKKIHEMFGTDVVSVFRISDYTFAVIMPGIDALKGKDLAKKLSKMVSEIDFGSPIPHITISMGLAVYPENGTDPKLLVSSAREALDKAISSGRNAFVIATDKEKVHPGTDTLPPTGTISIPTIEELKSIGTTKPKKEDKDSKVKGADTASVRDSGSLKKATPKESGSLRGSGSLRSSGSLRKVSIPIAPPPEEMEKKDTSSIRRKSGGLLTFRSARKKEPLKIKTEKKASVRRLLKPKPSEVPPKEEEPKKVTRSDVPSSSLRKTKVASGKLSKEKEKSVPDKIQKGGKKFVAIKPEVIREAEIKKPSKPWIKVEPKEEEPKKAGVVTSETSLLKKAAPQMRKTRSATSKLPPLPSGALKKPMVGLIRRSKTPSVISALKRRTAGSSIAKASKGEAPKTMYLGKQKSPSGSLIAPKKIDIKLTTGKVSKPSTTGSGKLPHPPSTMAPTTRLPRVPLKTIRPAVGPAKYQPKAKKSTTPVRRAAPPGAQDPVTGFYFKSYFEQSIGRMILRAKQTKRPLSLLFFKLDKHKELKVRYGQAKLNNVLKEIAHMIKNFLKEGSDLPARYSDEIFVIILPDTSYQIGFNLAEQIRFTIGNLTFKDIPGQITLSLGIASYPEKGKSPREVMKHAYDAMVYAIKSGGNKSLIWDEKLFKNKK